MSYAQLDPMDQQRFELEMEQIRANTTKLQAETIKLQREARWFPAVWAVAFIAAVLSVAKFLHM